MSNLVEKPCKCTTYLDKRLILAEFRDEEAWPQRPQLQLGVYKKILGLWLFLVLKVKAKMFRFLNQCFARLRFWKSVSDSPNLLDGATAVLLETLFQNRSRAKH